MTLQSLPRVMADGPLAPIVLELMQGKAEWAPWNTAANAEDRDIIAIYTYGHPHVDAPRCWIAFRICGSSATTASESITSTWRPRRRGRFRLAIRRGFSTGRRPTWALPCCLATARRVVEGFDRYARSPEFTKYDPGYMLGHEVHGATLGIIGLGRDPELESLKRGTRFRHARAVSQPSSAARDRIVGRRGICSRHQRTARTTADYLMLCCPLTDATRGLMNRRTLARMKPSRAC